jgi:hypothetical protein
VLALAHTDLYTPLQVAQLEAAADMWVAPVPDDARADVPEPMLYPAPAAAGPWAAQARWTDPDAPGKRRMAQAWVRDSSGSGSSGSLVWTSVPTAAAGTRTAAAPMAGGPRTTTTPAAAPSSLTFNVSLSAQQRQARAHVVLPYGPASPTPPATTAVTTATAAAATASVTYHAEAEDDMDEDDPDADLDI